jgi:hypothetical protein
MQPAHIIKYNGETMLSKAYLQQQGFSEGYLRVAKHNAANGSKSWMFENVNGCTYFYLKFMPMNAIKKVSGIFKTFSAEIQHAVQNLVSNALLTDFKALLNRFESKELAQAAAVIQNAQKFIVLNNLPLSKSWFFSELAAEIRIQQIKYLPFSAKNIQKKIRAYHSGTPLEQLICAKNLKNQHAAAFKSADIKSAVLDLAQDHRNYTAAKIADKLETFCLQNGIPRIPSERWVSDFMSKPETKFLIQERYGANSRFNARYRAYVPTQSALYAGDCWDIDGSRVNLIDHFVKDKKTGRYTKKFLYVVVVRDVMSGLPLGWDYCHEESAAAIINALSMAARNAGYLPYEIRHDRFPGHNTEKWQFINLQLQKIGVKMTCTHKAESKAHVERWFGTLQNVFMSESDYYYGEGIRSSRPYAHRSKEYVMKMRRQATARGFNFDDACALTNRILEAYSTTPLSKYSRKYAKIDKSPLELHSGCAHPNTCEISQAQYCFLFGIKKRVSIRNYMIQTRIDGATYYYGVDDCEVVEKYTGVKTLNVFDPENLDTVHLFNLKTEQYLGSYMQITPAQQYGPKKDMQAVGKLKQIAEKMNESRKNTLAQIAKNGTVSGDSEVGVLLAGKTKKPEYETAETQFLLDEWQDEGDNLNVNIFDRI